MYEIIRFRHSIMLIGESDSGKSSIINLLKMALNKLAETPGYNKVQLKKLNPKSI